MSKKMLVLCFVLLIVLIYIIMFLNTNSAIDEVKNVMLGNVDISVSKETPLKMYNYSNVLQNAEVDVNITRIFVIHNFLDGYMWVCYSHETTKNDLDFRPGSGNIISRWKIHRENGEWKIVEIKEAP